MRMIKKTPQGRYQSLEEKQKIDNLRSIIPV